MKSKKYLVLLGTLIVGMVFGLIMAGCASTGETKESAAAATVDMAAVAVDAGAVTTVTLPTAAELAAAVQLAADLNAIKEGSATVEGATVKLTGTVGFLGIPRELVVPAGVTLDMTADGARLGLGEGGRGGLYDATLTVNGTVITKGDRIGFEDNAKAATINGSGTIYLNGRGRLLRVAGNLSVSNAKLTLDGVTLVGVPDNGSALVEVHNGGELVMKSGAITGNTTSDSGGGVRVNGGTFTMQGGAVSGTAAKGTGEGAGGGVWVNGGTFSMEGGEVTGNSATRRGGGVFAIVGSAFTMKGGTISGNTSGGDGGGVFVNSVFTMEGGTIYGSSAEGGNANTAQANAALRVRGGTAKWGTGGTYTKGGASQTSGSDIGNTDDTLVAVPRK
jgi:hypothetical protein